MPLCSAPAGRPSAAPASTPGPRGETARNDRLPDAAGHRRGCCDGGIRVARRLPGGRGAGVTGGRAVHGEPDGGALADGTDVSGVGSPDGRTPVGVRDPNHGSWVASLAAGRGNPDGTGMIGVAPEAELLSISLGFPGSASTTPFADQVVKAMKWA